MKMLYKSFVVFVFLNLILAQLAFSQDSLSVQDTAEINYRATLLLNEYQDLLNIISNSAVEPKQCKDAIFRSHSVKENKIFTDSSAQVEDDVDLSSVSRGQAKEFQVVKYLNNFDLFYSKSDSSSVTFYNHYLSHIKKADYLYIKVYYTSLFKNKNTYDTVLKYQPVNRVAEIKMDKIDGKWSGNIIHVGFSRDSISRNDTVNDFKTISLTPSKNVDSSSSALNGFASNQEQPKSLDSEFREKARQKEVQDYSLEKVKYTKVIEQGDEFLKNNDYASASKMFEEAQELMPYELYPKLKINQIQKQAQQSAINKEQLFKEFIYKAQMSENSRKYDKAKELYENAFSEKPEERKNWIERLDDLDKKIRNISIFEDKYNSGLFQEDIKNYDKVIRNDNTNSDYYLGRGKCYDTLGNYSRALSDYSKSIDLDKNNLESLLLRGALYARHNEPFKALEDYKIYLTIYKSNIDVYVRRSNLHQLTNNIKGAIDDLDQAISVNPRLGYLYQGKGLLLQLGNLHHFAIQNFSIAIKLDTSDANNFFYRGKSKYYLDSIDGAANDFFEARQKGLDSVNLRNIDLFAAYKFEIGVGFWQNKKLDSALKYYEQAIMLNPFSDMFRYKAGEIFLSKNDFARSIKITSEAIALNRSNQQAFYQRGLGYYNIANYTEAISDFENALKLNPTDYLSEQYCGQANLRIHQFKEAATHFENSLRIIKNTKSPISEIVTANIYNSLGKAYFQSEDFISAIENFRNAIKLNNQFAEAYYNRGEAEFKSEDLNDASKDIAKAILLEGHKDWNYTLGIVLEKKKNYLDAENCFSNSATCDSILLSKYSIYHAGYCAMMMRDFERSKNSYLKSIENGLDTLKRFYDEIGNVFLNTGNYDSSYLFFRKAYDRDSTDAFGAYGIAKVLCNNNKIADSYEWFGIAFKLKQIDYSEIKKDKLLERVKSEKLFKELIKKYYD